MTLEAELAAVVGKERISSDVDVLRRYSRDHSFVREAMPQLLVEPRCAEEVQNVVLWANKLRVPLTPVSSGEPHFHGDTIPAPGGIIVDLREMNRIVRVDRRNRVAMIEPGVTFSQLLPELEREGLRLLTPLCPRSTKSVITSYLEKSPMIIPKYHTDMTEPLACIEVIFGTGDSFRTGEAAGPGSIEEQWEFAKAQKFPSGPGQVSFYRFTQGAHGGLGIVTWATIRCEILPKIQQLLIFPIQDVGSAVDFVYQTTRRKLGDECLLLNNLDLASILGEESRIQALRESLPPWVLLLGVAGYETLPEERVSYQTDDILDIGQQFGLFPRFELAGIDAKQILALMKDPSPEPYWKLRHKGDSCDVFFLTTLDRVPDFINLVHRICESHGFSSGDLGIYIQPIQEGRACHCEFSFFYDPSSNIEARVLETLLYAVSDAILKEGGFFSSLSYPWMQAVCNRDAASRDAIRKIKKFFDPNNILPDVV